MKYLLGTMTLVFAMAAMGTECYTDEGHLIEIPAGKQIILVPAHWLVEEIYRESHRAEKLPEKVEPRAVEEDCLVLSPASSC